MSDVISLARFHTNRIRELVSRDTQRMEQVGESAAHTFEGALLKRMRLILEYVDELEADLAVYGNDEEDDEDEQAEDTRLD